MTQGDEKHPCNSANINVRQFQQQAARQRRNNRTTPAVLLSGMKPVNVQFCVVFVRGTKVTKSNRELINSRHILGKMHWNKPRHIITQHVFKTQW